jgi:membrane protein DedA with SNARE-associated domain
MKNFEISDNLKNDVLINLIEPSYKNEIKQILKLRKQFKNYGIFFETVSKMFVGVTSIISFSAGIYKYEILAFLAGSCSVISLVLLQYASFSYRESKKMSIELNNILRKLNIQTLNIENISTSESLDNIEPLTPLKK